MQIRKHSKFVFDVFQGNGFDCWTRIRKFHWGYKVVNGNWLPKNELQSVIQKLDQFPNGSIDEV